MYELWNQKNVFASYIIERSVTFFLYVESFLDYGLASCLALIVRHNGSNSFNLVQLTGTHVSQQVSGGYMQLGRIVYAFLKPCYPEKFLPVAWLPTRWVN